MPVGAVQLGEGAPQGVVLQGLSLFGEEVAVGGAAAGREGDVGEDGEGLPLELPDGVAVDQGALVEDSVAELSALRRSSSSAARSGACPYSGTDSMRRCTGSGKRREDGR